MDAAAVYPPYSQQALEGRHLRWPCSLWTLRDLPSTCFSPEPSVVVNDAFVQTYMAVPYMAVPYMAVPYMAVQAIGSEGVHKYHLLHLPLGCYILFMPNV